MKPATDRRLTKTSDNDASVGVSVFDASISYADAKSVFASAFVLYGILATDGVVYQLDGRIFDGTFADPSRLVGQRLTETVFWQTSDDNFRLVNDAVSAAGNGLASKTIVEFRKSKDETCILEIGLTPLPEGRPPERIFISAVDVTAREGEIKFHRERAEHLLYAAESADVGLWFWNLEDGRIFSTPKCNEFFGADALFYPELLDYVHPEDRNFLVEVFTDSQRNGDEYDVEYRVLNGGGEVRWLSTRGKTYFDSDGVATSMMGVVRRIPDRNLTPDEQARATDVARRARDEAEEASRTKDHFLALVSHELRTPLNAILGWTKILMSREVDEKTRRSALETIERSALSQAKLLSDLVDSSRIASGKMKLEMRPMNLCDAVATIVNSQRPVADARSVSLTFSAEVADAAVFGDLIRLQQVFNNLLSNALKFTDEGGRIAVKLSVDAHCATVRVEDNGRGIKPETLPHIFRQFSQGEDSSARDTASLGLGLSIVKTLVEKHGGSVRAESEGDGKGATFVVELPLYSRHQDSRDTQGRTRSHSGNELVGRRILCVEDDADSREVLQLFLEQHGAVVKCAASAADAMMLLTSDMPERFDALISDLAMPNEDGYSFIARVRELTAGRRELPAIALSAFSSLECRRRASSSGFQKYHSKPFNPDRLIDDLLEIVDRTE